MNFTEAYNYILSLHNLPRKEYMNDPRHCGWYLKRLQFFLDMIGNPERKIPHYIHVTGTSGKGSVTAYLHSILHSAGKKVGSTYSPHPTIITERWKIGNKFMTKKEFAKLVEYLKPKLDEYLRTTPYDMLSFFEITEAIGLLFFAQNKVSWAVMEVACGGRTDSSNIIPWKDAAVITNIGVDHIGVLGKNKKEIAYEKAGIIKRGNLVFTAEHNKQILKVIQNECHRQKASLKIANFKFKISEQNKSPNLQSAICNLQSFIYENQKYSLPCLGKHQIKNAILCIDIAQALKISDNAIKKGLMSVAQPLRMEIISKKPLVILDGAHNPDKMKTTVDTVRECAGMQVNKYNKKNILAHLQTYTPIHLLVGFSGDKNINKMIKQLATLKPKTIAITRNTTNPFRKVANPQLVQKQFKKLLPQTKTQIFLDPHTALAWLKKLANKDDIILSTGSIFVSGELRQV